ncbi:glycoside hydrolase family 88 protein [Agarivorans sp. TSD2052]|uniref:glycoside hydrolase family 88 protein n=1 Tax=Agarivorans sp. TSD2052 TaxID=2937286 RepID=UPI00200F5605|nr:glycoside hydrolase family 88 protein [Agarivorans sp. TSD2052]UPW19162.1 glycoside hydrolase family 88 protein [Agarivorans sp. TSD2052]
MSLFTINQTIKLAIASTIILSSSVLAKGINYPDVMALIEHKSTNLAINALSDNKENFTAYTDSDGQWITEPDRNWCSGFVPGIFWYLNALTNDEVWQQRAKFWTDGVRSRAYATDNDTGFQIFDSFGLGYTLGGNATPDYKKVLIGGANTMVEQRYNKNIGTFRSWRQGAKNPTILPFEVNIDQLMNMELILWVGQNADKPDYTEMAISHADKTWEHNLRKNASTYHVVGYGLDGKVVDKRTHQGWKADSTWSRGQAWSVYAYAMYYRYTGLERMLERSIKSYEYFIEATKLQTQDFIPYADFDAPIDDKNPRDSSATAIVASALLELYKITNEEKYLVDAESMLTSLATPEFLAMDPEYQSILLKGSEKWGEEEVGTIFGDYFFIEALYRWQQWSPRKLPSHFGL